MPPALEICFDPNEVYLGHERGTNPFRPVFTGDVFELADGTRVIIAEHPCAMRAGIELAPSVLVAPVNDHDRLSEQRWTTGYFKCFPLPELDGPSTFAAAHLDWLDRRSSELLDPSSRIATLLPLGVNLLQQRLVWYLTRCLVATDVFEEAFSRYYEEAEIIEEWVEYACSVGAEEKEALLQVDEALSADTDGSQRLRDLLGDPQHRSYVRRTMRRQATTRYAPEP